ncbi:ECF transporter S component [Eubacterium oxidoreducens]|uniref:Uncharacterized membrane protein n=1 Tax=Eubacterium oxidoreducens TaxID=1732 RepID=A0A1G6A4W4_EUBOX|nr:ECF transporter S component [Eubacterium oxidoreducens]SDB03445.1 Uncharacterized membrane protein [Eubacterium oxidoreducens]
MKTKYMSQAAILIAFTFIITRFFQIPIPMGYFNVGNVIILISCVMLPNPYGIAVGAIGAGLADLTSYPIYTLPTLVIKALMALVFYKMMGKHLHDHKKMRIVAMAVSTLIPLFGYTLTGCVISGSFFTGLAQFPGLLVEYLVNIGLFVVASKIADRVIRYSR